MGYGSHIYPLRLKIRVSQISGSAICGGKSSNWFLIPTPVLLPLNPDCSVHEIRELVIPEPSIRILFGICQAN